MIFPVPFFFSRVSQTCVEKWLAGSLGLPDPLKSLPLLSLVAIITGHLRGNLPALAACARRIGTEQAEDPLGASMLLAECRRPSVMPTETT
jgi:hypothetical protein